MSFYDEISKLNTDCFIDLVESRTAADVERALTREGPLELSDFAALLSETARARYLKVMARQAAQLTRRRFGRTISMYIPLYLTNLCNNKCAYCGFSSDNKFMRVVLTMDEIRAECEAISAMGFENILLVTGENSRRGGMAYFREVLPLVREYAAFLQMEVQPLETEDYAELKTLGLDQVSVYQETYNPACYRENHHAGRKTDMRYRMETPERLGQAGIDKIGMGALLGLYDWRVDSCALALHVLYMRQHYWQSRLSVAFPRLRPAEGGYQPAYPVSDAQTVQLICAWRIFDPEIDITISTRESARFRDMVLPLGITAMSAQSSISPGGYATHTSHEDLGQWTINDDRSVDEVVAALHEGGFEAVFHDASTTFFKAVGMPAESAL